MASGISVKLPLHYSSEDGPYQLTKTLPETVKQNFKHMILTNPGEKIMDPEFGIGVSNFLFENQNSDVIDVFNERLHEQVNKYLPFVTILEANSAFSDANVWNIQISYFIKPLGVADEMSLELLNQGN